MEPRPSTVPAVGFALGTILGLAPLLYLSSGSGLSPGSAVFLGTILGASLLPWLVFDAAQRSWPRPLAVAVLVAIGGLHVAGFVAIELDHPEEGMGEISMLGVDPDRQGAGTGTALTEFALERLKEAGMGVAMVETGGDPGHAPARRAYEKADFALLPIARYFKNL